MARMNVEARAARAGRAAAVFVSVADDAGKAITDLRAGDLSVRALAPPPGAELAALQVAVAEVSPRGEGIYVAAIVLAPAGAAWPSGEHVLAVDVRRVFDRGQTLAVLAIP